MGTGKQPPLEEVCGKYPMQADKIKSHCLKWHDRTKGDTNPWPQQGSYDPKLLIQLEGKIQDHKRKDKSEERRKKRQEELETLGTFMGMIKDKVEGKEAAIPAAQQPEMGKEKGVFTSEASEGVQSSPPPYTPPVIAQKRLYPQLPEMAQCPVVQFAGTAEVSGDNQMKCMVDEVIQRLIRLEEHVTSPLEENECRQTSSENRHSSPVTADKHITHNVGMDTQGFPLQLRKEPEITVEDAILPEHTCELSPVNYPYLTEPEQKRMEEKRLQEQSRRQARQNIFLLHEEEELAEIRAHQNRGAGVGEIELAEIRELRMTLAKEAQQLSETLIQELSPKIAVSKREIQGIEEFWKKREQKWLQLCEDQRLWIQNGKRLEEASYLLDDIEKEMALIKQTKITQTEQGLKKGDRRLRALQRMKNGITDDSRNLRLLQELEKKIAEDDRAKKAKENTSYKSTGKPVRINSTAGHVEGSLEDIETAPEEMRERSDTDDEESSSGVEEVAKELPVLPFVITAAIKKAARSHLGQKIKRKMTKVEHWGQMEEYSDSDADDGEDTEPKGQCPITILTKKEVMKESEKVTKELKKMKGRLKQIEQFLMQKEKEKQKEEEGSPVQSGSKMMPLITLPMQHYQPWGHTDVAGLISRLPLLQDSAAVWVTQFENETEGKTLCLGDIKALLSQILTKETARTIFDKADMKTVMGNPMVDDVPFNEYRNKVWQALRETYPNTFSLTSMAVDKLKPDENPAVFVESTEANWRMTMESDPESNLMMRHLMKKAILDALPPPVKTELDKDHHIGIMPRSEFRDAVTNFVNLNKRAEENMSKQDTERQRKLVLTQLDNAKWKKKIVQAPVIEAPFQSYPAPAPAPTASPVTSAPTRAAPQGPQPMQPEYAYGPPQPSHPYWQRH